MSISKLFPSKYLKGDDIEDGDTVTITKVTVERVGIDQEEKPVIHFEEKDKGVILNKTNAQAIAKASPVGAFIRDRCKRICGVDN